MVIQGYLAYTKGYFWGPTSTKLVYGKVMTYWAKRHAVWSDILILSPLASYHIGIHGQEWDYKSLLPVAQVVIVACIGVNLVWMMYAYDRKNGFGEKWKMLAWGVCHFVYMVSILSVLVFYYLATDPRHTTHLEAVTTTTLACLHLLVGVLYQSYYHGVLRPATWLLTAASCGATLWGHIVLTSR